MNKLNKSLSLAEPSVRDGYKGLSAAAKAKFRDDMKDRKDLLQPNDSLSRARVKFRDDIEFLVVSKNWRIVHKGAVGFRPENYKDNVVLAIRQNAQSFVDPERQVTLYRDMQHTFNADQKDSEVMERKRQVEHTEKAPPKKRIKGKTRPVQGEAGPAPTHGPKPLTDVQKKKMADRKSVV